MDPRLNFIDTEKLLLSLADFLLPRECLVCGRTLLASERHLCSCCLADLPLTLFEGMSHNPMADRMNGKLRDDGAAAYQYAAALFHYGGDSGYANITQALKYHRNFAAGKYFARMLGERLHASGLYRDVDLVTCVPLHWTRRRTRGYNQAEVIAREVWRVLSAYGDVRFEPRLLKRVRRTSSQAHLSDDRKALNVEGAFAVRQVYAGTARHILILDDVFTTGSTLASCCMALREAFGPSVRISAATLAYAG